LRVVVDAGNGMAGKIFPFLFEQLPLEVVPLYFELDGRFPNHEANPLKAENLRELQEKVVSSSAHLGVAFDGDADRCVFVEETGRAISSDLVTALIARSLLTPSERAVVVYDLRSSHVVPEEISRAGGIPCQERVGHAFMKATMRKRKAIFGGELAGHYYYRDNYFADSAMITFALMLNILSAQEKPLSEIIAPLRRYFSTGEINFEVADPDAKIREIAKRFAKGRIHYLDGITVEFDEWWFNCRKSNTEPLLRLNLEAHSPQMMEKARQEVEAVIQA
jgi:phosphomannomutase